ncbi:MAG: DNA-processing protein DprA [Flavobacteriales bacterium]
MSKINEIKIESSKYPQRLKETKDPPDKLFQKGEWNSELLQNCLSVVGTRQMTKYGKKALRKIVHEISAQGITIVSGFMYGLDAQAHKAALEVNGKTIAVMPCGIEEIQPAHQKNLYKEILNDNGSIISELPDNHPPEKWTFVKRNRIVAGISQATLVVEGGKDSGTLITADFAKEYNRQLLAIPCPITSKVSHTPNNLIKEGAKMVTKPQDILDFFELKTEKAKTKNEKQDKQSLSKEEKQIIKLLENEPLSVDEISNKTGIDSQKLNTTLSKMELSGLIKEESSKFYVN